VKSVWKPEKCHHSCADCDNRAPTRKAVHMKKHKQYNGCGDGLSSKCTHCPATTKHGERVQFYPYMNLNTTSDPMANFNALQLRNYTGHKGNVTHSGQHHQVGKCIRESHALNEGVRCYGVNGPILDPKEESFFCTNWFNNTGMNFALLENQVTKLQAETGNTKAGKMITGDLRLSRVQCEVYKQTFCARPYTFHGEHHGRKCTSKKRVTCKRICKYNKHKFDRHGVKTHYFGTCIDEKTNPDDFHKWCLPEFCTAVATIA